MPDRRKTKHLSILPADSPFSDFLEKDRVPSLQERKIIQEMLVEKTVQLAHLNSRVPKRRTGKKIGRQLRIELDQTRRFIKFHQALISPWRRLPVEIMAEIFLFTLEAAGQGAAGTDFWDDDREGSLLVCRICRTWREIAISTPALWNILSLSLHSVSRPLEWISTWLGRARSLPLYLQVFWGDKALPEVINPIISLFASHLHHIAGLWIDGLDIDDPELVTTSYPHATFPPLQNPYAPLLTIIGADLPPESDWDWIRAASQASPRLTSLTTSQFTLDWFPVTNLTKLHLIDPVAMSTVLQVLQHAPGLQDISVDIEGPLAVSPTGSVLVMGSVSRLEITSSDHLGEFLGQIAMPRLADFGIHQIVVWPEAEFSSFLSRSSCVLHTLDLYDIDITEDQIIACLRQKACSMLHALVVSDCTPPSNTLLQYLTYSASNFPCPHLKVIELGNFLANDGVLADLAESRVRPVIDLPPGVTIPGRLEKLRISFIEGRPAAVGTHAGDWVRLLALQNAWPEFDVEWPEPEE
ncbi:hypothetical protein DFH09DRAFT_1163400 [Mycena vulgaris]|nr:hypothetical protein DFH09DRAFT_1163400 [Mycena vulgaris]